MKQDQPIRPTQGERSTNQFNFREVFPKPFAKAVLEPFPELFPEAFPKPILNCVMVCSHSSESV